MSETWDGLLPIDKPAGPTSHDLVARIRSATGTRRVGHTGTLDPPATGLLLLVIGRATRLARYVPDSPKTYRGTFTLGLVTTTDDAAGDVVRRHEGALPGADDVLASAAALVGRQLQVPPAFSARQVGGTRMYSLARRGVAVEAPASEVLVETLQLTPTSLPELWDYEMVVSTGTYVRAIVRDLGAALGCGASVRTLRRTAIGPFRVEDAVSVPADRAALHQAVRGGLVAIDAMPLNVPSIALSSPTDSTRFSAGGVVSIGLQAGLEGAVTAVRDDAGRLLGVGESRDGTLRPRTVLSHP